MTCGPFIWLETANSGAFQPLFHALPAIVHAGLRCKPADDNQTEVPGHSLERKQAGDGKQCEQQKSGSDSNHGRQIIGSTYCAAGML